MSSKLLLALTLILSVMLILAGCSSGTATTPGTTTSGATTSPNPSPDNTFGNRAELGASVFASKCALCHGNNGQGGTAPAVIGSGATLENYDTAQGLFNYIRSAMPANAPGSLTQDEYLNVTSHFLVKNDKVDAGRAFSESELGRISVK